MYRVEVLVTGFKDRTFANSPYLVVLNRPDWSVTSTHSIYLPSLSPLDRPPRPKNTFELTPGTEPTIFQITFA